MDEITIGIDASKATKGYKSGTEYYTQEIIKAIILSDNGQNKFLLYSKLPLDVLGIHDNNVTDKIMPFPPRLWTQLRLSYEASIHPPDVLFIPAHTIPLLFRCPVVTTIHDLGFKHYPNLYPEHEILYHNYSMNMAARRANLIIAISEYTKKDFLKYYPDTNPDKIFVIHHGFNRDRFRPLRPIDDKKFIPKYGKYILFVGRLEEKKNIMGLVKSYVLLRKERKIEHKLVLAGRPRFGFEKVQNYIDKLPHEIKKDIILTGYVSDEDLPILYREADIFLFPTFFEGFGMPILEAFASGVPVVASNTTSIPEVAGNAALLVNPKKPFEIASACSRIINKSILRRKLVSDGINRAKMFTWEKAGQKTLEVLLYGAKK